MRDLIHAICAALALSASMLVSSFTEAGEVSVYVGSWSYHPTMRNYPVRYYRRDGSFHHSERVAVNETHDRIGLRYDWDMHSISVSQFTNSYSLTSEEISYARVFQENKFFAWTAGIGIIHTAERFVPAYPQFLLAPAVGFTLSTDCVKADIVQLGNATTLTIRVGI